MAKAKQVKPVIDCKTQESELARIEALLQTASNKLHAVREALTEKFVQQWKDLGGCCRCRGRGWVVTWDTLDAADGSYADFGACPEPSCSQESRKATGLMPTANKYDRIQGVIDPLETNVLFQNLLFPLKSECSFLRDYTYYFKAEWKINQSELIVVRGRKNVGARGVLFWRGGQWDRIGIKLADGTVVWDYAKNAERVLTEDLPVLMQKEPVEIFSMV